MKYLKVILDYIKRNKGSLIIQGCIVVFFVVASLINNHYHRKEIKDLGQQIAGKEILIKQVIKEKDQFKSSALFFESAAKKSDAKIAKIQNEIQILQREKVIILAKLDNMSKGAIDTFINDRYVAVPKTGVNLVVDKKVGNEIVKELTEKDYCLEELELKGNQNKLLSNQVDTLRLSLNYSKKALTKAELAINFGDEKFNLSQEANALLNSDLKKAKHKSFWNTVKGIGIGIGIGVVSGLALN